MLYNRKPRYEDASHRQVAKFLIVAK